MKRCIKCGESKPFSAFFRRKGSRDGYRNTCKDCWRVKTREGMRQWRAANPSRSLELARDWRKRNPGKERARYRRYDEAHREQRRLAIAKSRAEKPDYHRELRRKWREENPERCRDYWYRWFEGKQNPSGDTVRYIAILLGDLCGYCNGRAGQIDHVEPRTRHGTHDWPNLTAACPSCNPSKSNKPLLYWLATR